MNPTVKASDLRLGDVVRIRGINVYDTATVKQVADGEITLFRPYTATADFTCTSGVICYVGVETFKVPVGDQTYELVRSSPLLPRN